MHDGEARTAALREEMKIQFENSANVRSQKYVYRWLRNHVDCSFNRTLCREFGPAAYGVFQAKNVKASRGVRGKSYSIRISDTKWRYPKKGRH